ncbi:MAG: InlB B-repeat-containing protein, partial [Clostridia bacterium]
MELRQRHNEQGGKKGASSIILLVLCFLVCFAIFFGTIDHNTTSEYANAATGVTVSANVSQGNTYDLHPALYGNIKNDLNYSLTDYLGSSSVNSTVLNAFGNRCLDSSSNDSNAAVTAISNGVSIHSSTSYHLTSGNAYGSINVRVPEGIRQLIRAGLVTNITASFTGKNNNSDDHNYSIGFQMSNSIVVASSGISTGSSSKISDSGSTTTKSSTITASDSIYFHIFTYVKVDGVIWPGDRQINCDLYNFKFNVNLIDSVGDPKIYLGIGYPETTGASGKLSSLQDRVKYAYSNNDYSTMSGRVGHSYTALPFYFNNRSTSVGASSTDDTAVPDISIGKGTVGNYDGPTWYYRANISEPAINTQISGGSSSSTQVITVGLTNINSYGEDCYFEAYYSPTAYQLTLKETDTGRQLIYYSGWSRVESGNTTTLTKTVYYDNNFALPLANSIFSPTGGFAGWQETAGPNIGATKGDAQTLLGGMLTADIVLEAYFASYACLNPTTGDQYVDYNDSASTSITAGKAIFGVTLTEGGMPNTHYGQLLVTYNHFQGTYGSTNLTAKDYYLTGVYAKYGNGPLYGQTVAAVKMSSYQFRFDYLCGDYYIYSSWELPTQNFVTCTFNASGGLISGSSTKAVKFLGSAGLSYNTFPVPTRSSYLFVGWYSSTGGSGTRYGDSRIYDANYTGISARTSNITVYAAWQLTENKTNYSIESDDVYYFEGSNNNSSWSYYKYGASQTITLGAPIKYYAAKQKVQINVQAERIYLQLANNDDGSAYAQLLLQVNDVTKVTSATATADDGDYSWFTHHWGGWEGNLYMSKDNGSGTSDITDNYTFRIGAHIWNSSKNDNYRIQMTTYSDTYFYYTYNFKDLNDGNETLNTVTYKKNDGTSDSEYYQVKTSTIVGMPYASYWTRTGYKFLGWSTSSGSSTLVSTSTVYITGNVIYYAVWKKNQYQFNSWDVYFGQDSSDFIAKVRAPVAWEYGAAAITLAALNDKAGGTIVGHEDSTTANNPTTGFNISNWYSAEACTGTAISTISGVSMSTGYLKHTLNYSSVISTNSAPSVGYGGALTIDDYINITKPNEDSEYILTWNKSGQDYAFIFPDAHADYAHTLFEVIESGTYNPKVSTSMIINGGHASSGNTIYSSTDQTGITINATITPISLNVVIENDSMIYSGNAYSLESLVELDPLSNSAIFDEEHDNALSWYGNMLGIRSGREGTGLIVSSGSTSYTSEYSAFGTGDVGYVNTIKNVGSYTIAGLQLSKTGSINKNLNYVWELMKNTDHPQNLITDNFSINIIRKNATIYINDYVKDFGNPEPTRSQEFILPHQVQEMPTVWIVNIDGMSTLDQNLSGAVNFCDAPLTRTAGETVGEYNVSFDLAQVSDIYINNYTIAVLGFKQLQATEHTYDSISGSGLLLKYTFNNHYKIDVASVGINWAGSGGTFTGSSIGYAATFTDLKASDTFGLEVYADAGCTKLLKVVTLDSRSVNIKQILAGVYSAQVYLNISPIYSGSDIIGYEKINSAHTISNYVFKSGTTTTCGWTISAKGLTATFSNYFASGTSYVYNKERMGKKMNISGIASGDTVAFATTALTSGASYYGTNSGGSAITLNASTHFSGSTDYYFLANNATLSRYDISLTGAISGTKTYNSVADSGISNNGWFGTASSSNYSGELLSNFTISRRTVSVTWFRSDSLTSSVSVNQLGEDGFLYETGVNKGMLATLGNMIASDIPAFIGQIGSTNINVSKTNTSTTQLDIQLYADHVGTYTCHIGLASGVSVNDNYVVETNSIQFEIYINQVHITKWRATPGTLTANAVYFTDIGSGFSLNVTYNALTWTFEMYEAVDMVNRTYALVPTTGQLNLDILGTRTYAGNTGMKAQNYSMTVSLPSESNFSITNGSSVSFTINKKQISIDSGDWINYFENGTEFIYNGTSLGKKVVLSDNNFPNSCDIYSVDKEVFQFVPTFTTHPTNDNGHYIQGYQAFAGIQQGNYTVSLSLTGTSSYSLSGTTTASWTIAKRAITASFSGQSTTLTYSGDLQNIALLTISNAIGGETISLINSVVSEYIGTSNNILGSGITPTSNLALTSAGTTRTQQYKAAKSGEYSIGISLNSTMTNYTMTSVNISDRQIGKKSLVVTWTGSNTIIYDGTNHGITAKLAGLVGGDNAKLTTTSDFETNGITSNVTLCINSTNYNYTSINVGSYSASAVSLYEITNGSYIDVNNYTLSQTGARTYTITKRPLTTAWTGQSTPLNYNGSLQPIATLTVSNLVSGDSISLINSTLAEYYATTTAMANSGISPTATLNLVANSSGIASQVYNAAKAGYYTITIGLGTGTSNYDWNTTPANKVLTITDRPITKTNVVATWTGNDTINYDGDTHNLTINLSGIVGNEKIKLNVTSNFATNGIVSNTTLCNNGNYLFGAKDYNATAYSATLNSINSVIAGTGDTYQDINNYSLVQTGTHTYTINKRPLTGAFSSGSLTYNGSLQGIVLTINNMVSSETLSLTNSANAYTDSSKTVSLEESGLTPIGNTLSLASGSTTRIQNYLAIKSGYYEIAVVLNNMNNYLLTSISTNFAIDKKVLTASWASISTKSYNGNSNEVAKINIAGAIANEDITLNNSYASYYYGTSTTMNNSGLSPNSSTYTLNNDTTSREQSYYTYKSGNYSISIGLNSAMTNYTLQGTFTNSFSVYRSMLLIKWQNSQDGNLVISGTSNPVASYNYTYDSTNIGVKATVSGVVGAEKITFTMPNNNYDIKGIVGDVTKVVNATYAFRSNDAGTYEVGISAINSVEGGTYCDVKNYAFDNRTHLALTDTGYEFITTNSTYVENIRVKTIIDKKTITAVISSNAGLTYNGARQVGANLDVQGMVNSETITFNNNFEQKIVDGGANLTNSGAIPNVASFVLTSNVSGLCNQDFSSAKAGYYKVTVSPSGLNNYKFTTDGINEISSLTTNWTIGKRQISVVWTESGSIAYDGAYHGVNANISNIQGTDKVLFNVSYPDGFASYANAQIVDKTTATTNGNWTFTSKNYNSNSYKVLLSSIYSVTIGDFADTNNYTLSQSGDTVYTITKRALTASFSNNTAIITYNGSVQDIATLTINNIVAGENIKFGNNAKAEIFGTTTVMSGSGLNPTSDITLLANGSGIATQVFKAGKAGYYTATINLDSTMLNYSMSNVAITDREVQKAEVVASWDSNVSTIYNSNTQNKVVTISGIQGSDKLKLTINSTFTTNDIISNTTEVINGNYNFSANQASAVSYVANITNIMAVTTGLYADVNNYILTQSGTNSYLINKRPLSISWTNDVDKTYTGALQEITSINISNAVAGESINLSSAITPKYIGTSTNILNSGITPTGNISLSDASTTRTQAYSSAKAGDYTIIVSLNNMNNYCFDIGADTTKILHIMPKQTIFEWQVRESSTKFLVLGGNVVNFNTTYTGTNQGINLKVTGIVGTEKIIVSTPICTYPSKNLTGDGTQISNNSEYYFTAKDVNGVGYETYVGGIVDSMGGVYSDKNNYLFDKNSNYYLESDSNYQLIIADDANLANIRIKTTIDPKKLTVSWIGNDSIVYNATKLGKTLQVIGAVTSDDIDLTSVVSAKVSDGGAALSDSGLNPTEAIITLPSGDTSRTKDYTANKAGYYTASISLNTQDYVLTTDGTNVVTEVATSWTITKRSIHIDWIGGNASSVYDGLAHNVTIRLSGIQGGDYVSFAATTNYEVVNDFNAITNGDYLVASTNVGIYKVTDMVITDATGYLFSSKDNYTLDKNLGTDAINTKYEINKRLLKASFSVVDISYTGSAQGSTFTIINAVMTDDINITSTFNAYVSNGGDALIGSGLTPSANLLTLEDGNTTRTQNYNAYKAGYYTVEIALDGMDNYNLSVDGIHTVANASTAFTIKKAIVVLAFSGSGTCAYDGTSHGVNLAISGIRNNEKLSFSTSSTNPYQTLGIVNNGSAIVDNGTVYFNSIDANANSYNVSITGITDITVGTYSSIDNYTISVSGSSGYTITKRALTVIWTTASGIIYNGENQGIEVTIGNKVLSDEIEVNITKSANIVLPLGDTLLINSGSTSQVTNFRGKVADSYAVAISGITSHNNGSNNYLLSVNSGVFEISKKVIEITWTTDSNTPAFSGFDVEYSGSTRNIYASVNPTSLISGDTANITPNSFAGIDVGTYTAVVSSIDNSNYCLPTISTKQWHITPKTITASWQIANANYQGEVINLATLKLTGIAIGDIVGLVNTTIAKQIGTSSIINNSGASPVSGSTIGINCTEGSPIPEYNFGGVRTADYTTTIAMSSNVTTYPNNANYTLIGDLTGTYTIGKATITITWTPNASNNIEYDGNNYGVTATITGIQNSELIVLIIASDNYANKGIVSNSTQVSNSSYIFTSVFASNYSIAGISIASVTYSGSSNVSTRASISVLNYDINANEGNTGFTIAKRIVTISSWDYSIPFVYDGTTKTVNATVGNTVGADLVSFTYLTDATNKKVRSASNADIYTAVVSGCNPSTNYRIANSGDSGYTATDWELNWQIDKRNLSVAWTTAVGLVYTAGEQGIFVNITNIVKTDVIGINFTSNGTSPVGDTLQTTGTTTSLSVAFNGINASTYNSSLTALTTLNNGNKNYNLPINNGTFTIAPKEVGFDWDYSGTPFEYFFGNWTINVTNITGIVDSVTLGVTYADHTLDRYIIGATVYNDYVVGSNTASEANTYTAIVNGLTGTGHENYKLPTEEYAQKVWLIAKRAVNISWNEPNLTYNSFGQGLTVTLSNIVSGDGIGFVANISGLSTAGSVFSLEGLKFTYDTSSSDSGYDTYVYGFNQTTNAGSYTVLIVGVDADYNMAGNYYILAENNQKSYTIQQKEATFNWVKDGLGWTDYTTEYNGNSRTVIPEIADGVVCSGDTANITYAGYVGTNAGNYTTSVSSISNKNYKLGAIVTKNWTITKRIIGIEWFYGATDLDSATIRYNGTMHTVTAVATNVVIGQDVSFTLTNNAFISKGTYIAKATIAQVNSDNYAFDNLNTQFVDKAWEILARIVSSSDVDWGTTSFEYDHNEKEVVATIINKIGGDTLLIGYQNVGNDTNKATNKGTYNAIITSLGNANYEISGILSKQWVITPKLLTVSFTTGTYTYDGNLHGITLTISGIVADDNIKFNYLTTGTYPNISELEYSGSTGILTQTFGAVKANAIDYTASVESVTDYNEGDENYTLLVNSGKWKINKAIINLSWSLIDTNSGTYDGTSQGVKVNVSGIVSEEKVAFVTSNTFAQTTLPIIDCGNGQYTFTSINSGNYGASINAISAVSTTVSHPNASEAVIGNYTIATSGINTHSINQRQVEFVWTDFEDNGATTDSTWIYDKLAHGRKVNINNILSIDATAIEFGYSNGGSNTPSKALFTEYDISGTMFREVGYTFTSVDYKSIDYTSGINSITTNPNNNYCLSSVNRYEEWDINKRLLTVSWAYDTTNGAPIGNVWTYDKQEHGVILSIDNIVSGDTPTFSINNTGSNPAFGDSIFTATSSGTSTYQTTQLFVAVNHSASAYLASLSGVTNNNYQLPTAGLTKDWIINQKLVSLSYLLDGASITSTIYDRTEHIVSAVVTGLISGDETTINLINNLATNVNTYQASATSLSNTNYKLPTSTTFDYEITKRDIAAVLNNTDIEYKASKILSSDLDIEFSNVVLGDTISYTTNVETVDKINIGDYTFQVAITESNYNLTNAVTDIDFSITPFIINKSSLSWEYVKKDSSQVETARTNIDWPPTVGFETGVYHNFEASTAGVFSTAGVSFGYTYFGFCTCGQYYPTSTNYPSDTYTFDISHQWWSRKGNNDWKAWYDYGPNHAGTYFVVLDIQGINAGNFEFDENDDGYDDTAYFSDNLDGTFALVYPNSSTEIADVPSGENYVLKFNVAQTPGGFVVGTDDFTKTFDGLVFKDTPTLQGYDPEDMTVYIDNIQYTYAQYQAQVITREAKENAYNLKFTVAGGGTNTCDNIGGTSQTVEWTLTVNKRKLIITNTATVSWTKTYDTTDSYTEYSIAAKDDVSSPPTGIVVTNNVTVTANYATPNAGILDIIFTLTGVDYKDYFFEITGDNDNTTTNTVSGEIEKQVIAITSSDFNKVYNKTNAFSNYAITTGSILTEAPVTVSASYFAVGAGNTTINFVVSGSATYVPNYTMTINGSVEDTFSTAAIIYRKGITIDTSITSKVYDSTDTVNFSYNSSAIIYGDILNITGTYDNQHAGTSKVIIYSLGVTTDAANYKFGADGTDLEPTKATITLSNGVIQRRTLTLIWVDDRASEIYNNSVQVVTLTIKNIVVGDILDGISDVGVNSSSYDNVGVSVFDTTYTYANTVASSYHKEIATTNADYVILANSINDWEIKQRGIVINWSTDALGAWSEDFETVYNKQTRTLTCEIAKIQGVTESGLVLNDNLNEATTNTSALNVGDYQATFVINNSNYYIDSGANRSWSIEKATITGKTIADLNVDYNGFAQTIDVDNTSSYGDVLTIDYTITPFSGTTIVGNGAKDVHIYNSAVSYYIITATLTNSNYYDYNVPNEAESIRYNAKLTINPVDITNLSISSRNVDYDAEIQYLYINEVANHSITSTTTQIGVDTVNIEYNISTLNGTIESGVNNGAKNVGTYTINVKVGESNTNYNSFSKDVILTITPADILNNLGELIALDSINKIEDYNCLAHSLEVSATDGDSTQFYALDNAVISISYTINNESGNSAINAGDYRIVATIVAKISGIATDNYVPQELVGNLTINKATIYSVDNDDTLYIVGASIDYNNKNRYLNVNTVNAAKIEAAKLSNINIYPKDSLGYTVGNDIAEITYTYIYTAESEEPVAVASALHAGSYQVSAVIKNNNYDDLILASVELVINPIDIENVYLNLPDLMENPDHSNQRHYDYTNSYYSIGVSRDAGAINTTIIDRITLTIGGENTSDIADVSYAYQYKLPDGTVFGAETEFNNSTAKNAGSYYIIATIAPSGESSKDYNTKQLNNTMIIARVDITSLHANDSNTVYDGVAKEFALASNSTQFDEVVNIRYAVITDSGATDDITITDNDKVTMLNADGYNIFAYINETSCGSYNNNYFAKTVIGRVTIAKATIYGVSYTNTAIDYDGNKYYLVVKTPTNTNATTTVAPSANIDISPSTNTSFVESATISYLQGGLDFTGATHAGSYIINAKCENANYNNFEATATLTINKVDMWATVSGQEAVTSFYYVEETDNTYTLKYDTNTYFINVGTTSTTLIVSDDTKVNNITIRPRNMSLANGIILSDTASIEYLCDGSAFAGAKNAGTYALTAIIHNENDDYNDITLNGTLIIEKVLFAIGDGNLPEIFFTGSTMVYDTVTHFVGISNTAATYVDSMVGTIDLLTGDGQANIKYYYNQDNLGTYTLAFVGAKNAGNYYLHAYTEIADSEIAQNYELWEDEATLIIEKLDFIDETGHLGQLYLNGQTLTYDADTHYVGVSKTDVYINNLVSSLEYESLGLTIPVNYTYNYNTTPSGNFAGAINVGVYNITATISATANCEGWTKSVDLIINKLDFIDTMGHLGSLYFVDNSLNFDMQTHYIGVNNVNATLDSQVDSLSYFDNKLIIPINYSYNEDNGTTYSVWTGSDEVGIYYLKAEISDTINYCGWADNAILTINQLEFNDTLGQLGNLYIKDKTLDYDTLLYYTGVSKQNIWTNSLPNSLS